MASSTRRKAIELWNTELPSGDPIKLAKILFSYENPPGTREFSGSQDALGIVLPGLNKLYYNNNYWPSQISSVNEESILSLIEDHIFLINLGPRHSIYNVMDETIINEQNSKYLAEAAENCWDAIMRKDVKLFGEGLKKSFVAQIKMFPRMMENGINKVIKRYEKHAYGWKLSGAGGGGYLILVAEKDIPKSIKIKIRRKNF
jgi:galactokinase/mevalonate kinase-like predicted kinase